MLGTGTPPERAEHFVGRDVPLGQLTSALDDAMRRGGRLVLLGGSSGVGKSTLMNVFGREVVRRGGAFAYGRVRPGVNRPYAAIGEALPHLVHTMSRASPAEQLDWQDQLDDALAPLGPAIGVLVPELGGSVVDREPPAMIDAADARSRLRRAVTRLVAVTARFRPVVFAIDDLQWADDDSLSLIAEVLAAGLRNVLVFGAYRADEFATSQLRDVAAACDTIALEALTAGDVTTLIADAGDDPTQIRLVASEVHDVTGGNALMVHQLLRQIHDSGMVRLDAATGLRHWDLSALDRLSLPTRRRGVLEHLLDQLRPSELTVLTAVACIGHEFDLDDAVTVSGQDGELVADALWSALDLRLLEAFDVNGRRIADVIDLSARYRFSHDRITEAASARLPERARQQVHLDLGRKLVRANSSERIFAAAHHLGLGLAVFTDLDDRVSCAAIELEAARRARLQASFPLALQCYETGLALIGRDHWTDHPTVVQPLLLGAAEAAFLVSDFERMSAHLDAADTMIDAPLDRARVAQLRVKGLAAQHHLLAAVDTALDALDALGTRLPRKASKAQVAVAVARMKLVMRRWPDEKLVALAPCTDPVIEATQTILGQLHNFAYLARPNLFALVVLKEIELTLAHGLVASAPVAFASYGVLLVAVGDESGSQRFGEISLRLAERDQCRDARPQAQFLYFNFIRHWQRPMSEGLSLLPNAYRDALDRGDPETAGFLAAVLLYQSFWVGRRLAEIDALAQAMIPSIRSHRVPSGLCRSTQQLCLNLMGRSADPFLLAGESGYDERDVLPVARRENDTVTISAAAITKLGLHFWCGDYAAGIALADETEPLLIGMVGTPNVQLFHMANAISRIHSAPSERSTAVAVRRALKLHRRWARLAPENYGAASDLIDGLWARARGDRASAERHLDRAVSLSERHQLPLITALASEELGDLLAESGRDSMSRLLIRSAWSTWASVGMTVRCSRLEARHPWLRLRRLVDADTDAVDQGAIRQLTHGGETADVRELTTTLLGAALGTLDADRVILLLGQGATRRASAELRGGGAPTFSPGDVPYAASVVDDVEVAGTPRFVRAGTSVGSDDGPYLRRHGLDVALAVPIRARGTTIGALYAEGHDGRSTFTPLHAEALQAVCDHVGVIIHTVALEDELRDAHEQQRTLLEVQSRFVPGTLLRMLDIDDLRRVRQGHRVEREMNVLISDIRSFTTMIEDMTLNEAGDTALDFLRAVEAPIVANHGLLQDVRGDEVLAVFDTSSDDAVRAGLAMQRSLRRHNASRLTRQLPQLRTGIGINFGNVGLGFVGGVNRIALTVIGDAVNLASRIESANKRYGTSLLISEHTLQTLDDPASFHIRRIERVLVVNRRQPVTIHEVYDEDPEPRRAAKQSAQVMFDSAFEQFDAGDFAAAATSFEQCRDLVPGDYVAALHVARCEAHLRGELEDGPAVLVEK